jgi:hypothetical protein
VVLCCNCLRAVAARCCCALFHTGCSVGDVLVKRAACEENRGGEGAQGGVSESSDAAYVLPMEQQRLTRNGKWCRHCCFFYHAVWIWGAATLCRCYIKSGVIWLGSRLEEGPGGCWYSLYGFVSGTCCLLCILFVFRYDIAGDVRGIDVWG